MFQLPELYRRLYNKVCLLVRLSIISLSDRRIYRSILITIRLGIEMNNGNLRAGSQESGLPSGTRAARREYLF